MNALATCKVPARTLICAMAACILTVIFLGEIGHQACMQAAPHAALLRA